MAASESFGVSHAVLEQAQTKMTWPATATGVVRVLASHDVILRVGHQPEHDT
tara:strand:+ start:563 stop:718 length:156 start_codon:yes stop_codon:yes gene_type:complete